jgi:hypothetical protein
MLAQTLIVTTVASVLLAARAAAPLNPDGAAEARSKLTRLQADPNPAGRGPLYTEAMRDATAITCAARLSEMSAAIPPMQPESRDEARSEQAARLAVWENEGGATADQSPAFARQTRRAASNEVGR